MDFLPTVWMMPTACVRSIRSNTNRLTNLKNVTNVNKFQVQKLPKVHIYSCIKLQKKLVKKYPLIV